MAASPKSPPIKPSALPAGIVGTARANYLRGSTHKTREVARLIKERPVVQALAILAATNKGPARALSRIVQSAAANAVHQHPQLNATGLRIARITINDGPMWKRFKAVAMGRATRIRKRTSHITIEVASMGAVEGRG